MSILDSLNNGLGTVRQIIRAVDPQTGFNINEFKSRVLNQGVLKTNLYLVNFQQSRQFQNGLMFFTEAVNIPAIDLFTQQIRRYGYGPVENVPFRPVFTPMSMTFIVEASQQNILATVLNSVSSISSFMNYNNMSTVDSNGSLPYEVDYKSNYEFNLDVYVYNEQQDDILTYTFRNCYAKQVGGISLGWGNNDQYMKADVVFEYTDYSINAFNSNQGGGILGAVNSLQRILGIANTIETFNAIKRPQSVNDMINQANARAIVQTATPVV